jgi:dipeptidyl aminopeptidase/acylaminoacyl peptidase
VLVGGGRLWRAAVSDTQAAALTPARWDREVLRLVPSAGSRTVWSPDGGRSTIVTTRDSATARMGFAQIDLRSGRVTQLLEEAKAYGPMVVLPNERALAYVAEDAQHAPDVWLADQTFRHRRQLTHANPQLDGYAFGARRVITYRSRQGEVLRGLLVLPADTRPGRRSPLVAIVYPGGRGQWQGVYRSKFGPYADDGLAQLLATRGYAVLYPAAPQRAGTPVQDMVDAILPAIDSVVTLGVADSNRVGITGWSYGGYATLAMVTRDPRFKAAVMGAGFGDLFGVYGRLGSGGQLGGVMWAEQGQGLMGDTPWRVRDRYLENSPIWSLDRVETPLLILHGEPDAVWLADAVFVGLRRLGKTVEYRRYAGEGHGINSNVANLRDRLTATLRWFDTYLAKRQAAADPEQQ